MGDGQDRWEDQDPCQKEELEKTADQALVVGMPEERIYIIPLRRAKRAPRQKRAARAVKLVHEFLERHMKSKNIKLDQALNLKLWERGIKNPPPRIRVLVVKQDDGSVEASLAE